MARIDMQSPGDKGLKKHGSTTDATLIYELRSRLSVLAPWRVQIGLTCWSRGPQLFSAKAHSLFCEITNRSSPWHAMPFAYILIEKDGESQRNTTSFSVLLLRETQFFQARDEYLFSFFMCIYHNITLKDCTLTIISSVQIDYAVYALS